MRRRCRRLRRRWGPEVSPFVRTSANSPTSMRCSPRSTGSSGTWTASSQMQVTATSCKDVTEQSFDKVLASHDSAYVVGADFLIDGGVSAISAVGPELECSPSRHAKSDAARTFRNFDHQQLGKVQNHLLSVAKNGLGQLLVVCNPRQDQCSDHGGEAGHGSVLCLTRLKAVEMACKHANIIAKPLGGRVSRFFVAARKLRTKGGNGTTLARIVAIVGREVVGHESLQ